MAHKKDPMIFEIEFETRETTAKPRQSQMEEAFHEAVREGHHMDHDPRRWKYDSAHKRLEDEKCREHCEGQEMKKLKKVKSVAKPKASKTKKVTVAKGVKVPKGTIAKIRKKKGSSNAGKYKGVKASDFAGAAGGASKYSFPINSLKRAKSALKLAHNAPKPAAIKAKVYRKFPKLKKGK